MIDPQIRGSSACTLLGYGSMYSAMVYLKRWAEEHFKWTPQDITNSSAWKGIVILGHGTKPVRMGTITLGYGKMWPIPVKKKANGSWAWHNMSPGQWRETIMPAYGTMWTQACRSKRDNNAWAWQSKPRPKQMESNHAWVWHNVNSSL